MSASGAWHSWDGREEDDGLPARFAALLRTEKDPAANWDIDVASLLEDYLHSLELNAGSGRTQGNSQGSVSLASINFAQAALLIQGSAVVYGRKADFLYNLVLQALTLFSAQQEQLNASAARGESGEDDDTKAGRADEDAVFLELDDLPVLDEDEEGEPRRMQRRENARGEGEGAQPEAPPSQAPSILLGLEEELLMNGHGNVGKGNSKDGTMSSQEEALQALRYQSTFVVASSRMNSRGAILLPSVPDDPVPGASQRGNPGLGAGAGRLGGDRESSGADVEQVRKHDSTATAATAGASKDLHSGSHPLNSDIPGNGSQEGQIPGGEVPAWDMSDGGGDCGGDDDDNVLPRESMQDFARHAQDIGEGANKQPCHSVQGHSGSGRSQRARGEGSNEATQGVPVDFEDLYDPFVLLDPEDITGGLRGTEAHNLDRPYVRGRCAMRMPALGTLDWCEDPVYDPLMSPHSLWAEPKAAPRDTRHTRRQDLPAPVPLASLQHAVDFFLESNPKEETDQELSAGIGNQTKWEHEHGEKHQGEAIKQHEPHNMTRAEFEAAGAAPSGAPAEEEEEGFGAFGGEDDDEWSVDGGMPGAEGGDEAAFPGPAGSAGAPHADADVDGIPLSQADDLPAEDARLPGEGTDYDDMEMLRKQHIEALLRAAAKEEQLQQSALEKRVAQWQAAIVPCLQQQEDRGAFDIHDYAEKILTKLETKQAAAPEHMLAESQAQGCEGLSEAMEDAGGSVSLRAAAGNSSTTQGARTAQSQQEVPSAQGGSRATLTPFQDITAAGESYQVARYFSAMLHLVNQGNVEIIRPDSPQAARDLHGKGNEEASAGREGESGVTSAHSAVLGSQASVSRHGKGPAREFQQTKKGSSSPEPVCYTQKHSFDVRLLSSHRHHQEFLSYRLPAAQESEPRSGASGQMAEELDLQVTAGAPGQQGQEGTAREQLDKRDGGAKSKGDCQKQKGSSSRHPGRQPSTQGNTRVSSGISNEHGQTRARASEHTHDNIEIDCTPPIICTGQSATGT